MLNLAKIGPAVSVPVFKQSDWLDYILSQSECFQQVQPNFMLEIFF